MTMEITPINNPLISSTMPAREPRQTPHANNQESCAPAAVADTQVNTAINPSALPQGYQRALAQQPGQLLNAVA